MHTPTKTQWQTVIDNFKKILPAASHEGHLDMNVYLVHRQGNGTVPGHKCGTIHCVAGWYAIAARTIDLSVSYIGFSIGCDAMAEDLGFSDKYVLASWAHKNPKIWGNDLGNNLFGSRAAYNGADTLQEVVEYLEGVRDRSPD